MSVVLEIEFKKDTCNVYQVFDENDPQLFT